MRYKLVWTFATIAVALGLLVPAITIAEEAGTTQAETVQSDAMQLAMGARAWSRECSRCHNLRPPSELSDEEWEVSVTHMRVRANIPGDEADAIIAFLKASNN